VEVKGEFVENRATDPRITDEPFQLTAQEWSRWCAPIHIIACYIHIYYTPIRIIADPYKPLQLIPQE
jgi:hypothetical protein